MPYETHNESNRRTYESNVFDELAVLKDLADVLTPEEAQDLVGLAEEQLKIAKLCGTSVAHRMNEINPAALHRQRSLEGARYVLTLTQKDFDDVSPG